MVLLGRMLGCQLPNPLTQPLYPPQPLAERGFFPDLDVAVLHAGLCLAPTELLGHRSLPSVPSPITGFAAPFPDPCPPRHHPLVLLTPCPQLHVWLQLCG